MGDAPSSPLGTADSTDDYEEDEDEDSELDDWEPRQLEAFNPQNLCERPAAAASAEFLPNRFIHISGFDSSQGARSVTTPTPPSVCCTAPSIPSTTGRCCPGPEPVCLWSFTSTASWAESSRKDGSRSVRSSARWRRRCVRRANCRTTTSTWRWDGVLQGELNTVTPRRRKTFEGISDSSLIQKKFFSFKHVWTG